MMEQQISLSPKRSLRCADQSGASMIEYAVVVMFLVLVALIGVRGTGEALRDNINSSTYKIKQETAFGDIHCEPGSPIWPACREE